MGDGCVPACLHVSCCVQRHALFRTLCVVMLCACISVLSAGVTNVHEIEQVKLIRNTRKDLELYSLTCVHCTYLFSHVCSGLVLGQ